jgi:hypothetical protein
VHVLPAVCLGDSGRPMSQLWWRAGAPPHPTGKHARPSAGRDGARLQPKRLRSFHTCRPRLNGESARRSAATSISVERSIRIGSARALAAELIVSRPSTRPTSMPRVRAPFRGDAHCGQEKFYARRRIRRAQTRLVPLSERSAVTVVLCTRVELQPGPPAVPPGPRCVRQERIASASSGRRPPM